MKSPPAMSLERAHAVATAAQAAARNHGVPGISLVVLDIDGAIRVALREDPQGTFGIDIACAKARTALGFLRSSLSVAHIFKDAAVTMAGLATTTGGNLLALGGGVVVNDPEGRRIGAAAIAGSSPETDHALICTAIQAAGLLVQD